MDSKNEDQNLRDDMRDVYSKLLKKINRNGECLVIIFLVSSVAWITLFVCSAVYSVKYFTNTFTLDNPETARFLTDVVTIMAFLPVIIIVTIVAILQFKRYTKLEKEKELYLSRYPWLDQE